EALLNLMKREDVPILVGEVDNGIQVHGNERQQAIFRAFIEMINPAGQGGGGPGMAPNADPLVPQGILRLSVPRGPGAGRNEALKAELLGRRAMLADQAAEMQNRARELQKQAERVRKEAEKLQSKAEKTSAKAEGLTGPAQEAAIRQAEDISRQADSVTKQA